MPCAMFQGIATLKDRVPVSKYSGLVEPQYSFYRPLDLVFAHFLNILASMSMKCVHVISLSIHSINFDALEMSSMKVDDG